MSTFLDIYSHYLLNMSYDSVTSNVSSKKYFVLSIQFTPSGAINVIAATEMLRSHVRKRFDRALWI
jgi:hypothetical protein